MSLDTPIDIPGAPDHLGKLRLVLDDQDGTPDDMAAIGHVVVCDENGVKVDRKSGPPGFMPLLWRQQMRALLQELRVEVASRLTVQPTKG